MRIDLDEDLSLGNNSEMDTQNTDKSQVRLKGVKDGFWVTLDPTLSIDFIEEELSRLFSQLQHLAFNSRVILDIGESEGHQQIVENLAVFLKNKYKVGSVSTPQREHDMMEDKPRKLDMSSAWRQHHTDALIIAGRVRSGQKITAKKHLVILGDVNPGSEIIAGGDILIMGNLGGTALAGQPDNEAAIILAIGFKPIQIQIGGIIAAGLPTSSAQAIEFAHIENGGIVVEDYIKANPFGRLTWPVVR
jgi:septum site-determining protein MinC